MSTGIKEGMGGDVTFATSSLTLNFKDITLDGVSVNDIETSDQATTGGRTYIASTLVEGGTVSLMCNTNGYNLSNLYGAIGVSQDIDVRPPKVLTGDTTRPNYSFTGYIKSVSHVVGTEGNLQTHNISIKVGSTVTVTSGAV